MILEYFLVFWFALSAVTSVALVGKPRTAITPGTAAGMVVVNLGIIGAVLVWWPS